MTFKVSTEFLGESEGRCGSVDAPYLLILEVFLCNSPQSTSRLLRRFGILQSRIKEMFKFWI